MTGRNGPADVRLTDEGSIPGTIEQMTLLEKAKLCGGALPFETHAIERLGIPTLVLPDGKIPWRSKYDLRTLEILGRITSSAQWINT